MKYKIFDSHTHAFPDALAERTMKVLSEKAGIPHYHDGTFDGLCTYENGCGFLILPIATKATQTRTVNQWVIDRMTDRTVAFGSIHPENENFVEEIQFLKLHGIQGIKMHPEYQGFFVDDPLVFPLYEELFRQDMILYFHAGEDLGFPPPVHGSPKRLAAVCDAFPHGRIVAAHMGGFNQYQEVSDYLAGRNHVWLDTSFAAERMGAEEFVGLARKHGVDKILFGTDAPWAKFDDSLAAVMHSGLSEVELEAILYDNAARLLGL